jgi:hypothetical protein
MYVLLAHIALLIGIAVGLPGKYRWQQQFNQQINEARERSRPPAE